MDYEKAYKEALERARAIHNEKQAQCYDIMAKVFPELAESEDEKIRKEILDFIRLCLSRTDLGSRSIALRKEDAKMFEKWITYLEKHIEQKPAEWSLPKDFEEAVYKVANFISPFDSQDELRRVSHRFAEQLMSLAKKELVEKPAEWNEEDKFNLQSCIGKIELDMQHWGNHGKTMVDGDIKLIDWLKSLPERFELQPKQEWSVDDEIIRDSIIDYINSGNIYATSKVNMITWLKSLRPQPYWKPSKEQMEALQIAAIQSKTDSEALASLFIDLSKL